MPWLGWARPSFRKWSISYTTQATRLLCNYVGHTSCRPRRITYDLSFEDNALQKDPKKKVSPTDIANYYYLNAQAKNIIALYGATVAEFDEQVDAWKDHQNRVQLSSNSRDYIQHSSYDAIVAMGKDHAVPLIMARYKEDQNGWWHEVLHEIVHERKSGANEFDKPKLYKEWKEWYEAPGAPGAAQAA
jgi:hypothetical protein